MTWYFAAATRQTASELPKGSITTDRSQAETTPVRYDRLRKHVSDTINSVDETTDQLCERSARHSRTSVLGRDAWRRMRSVVGREEAMVARWKTTLRKMTEGEYSYQKAVIESKTIDAEGGAFLEELRSMTKEMQRTPGCHCGG
jgi:hypothetical protein